jgi:hypothetical protein
VAKTKTAMFIFVAISSFFGDTDLVGESPPFFIYPIVTIFMFLGSLIIF